MNGADRRVGGGGWSGDWFQIREERHPTMIMVNETKKKKRRHRSREAAAGDSGLAKGHDYIPTI